MANRGEPPGAGTWYDNLDDVNPAAPFGVVTSATTLDATVALLGSIGFLRSEIAPNDRAGDLEAIAFSGPVSAVGVDEIVVTVASPVSPIAVPRNIVRLAVADPLSAWCAWHLDGIAVAESDVDQFLQDPSAGLIVRCNDANRYELMPLANDALHNRAVFVEADPSMLTETVTGYCHDFGFRPIIAEAFHHHQQMTLLQRGGRHRMTLGLLTPNETPRGTTAGTTATSTAISTSTFTFTPTFISTSTSISKAK